ncbi:hypothetical protein Tco_0146373, partial [Tanacetum coccineum]
MEHEDEVNTPDVQIQARKRPESGEKSIEVKQEGSPDTSQGGRGAEEVNIEKEQLMRFIVMGQKSLPDPTSKKKGRPYWGFVEMVTTNIQDIKDALKGEEYETKTRGHRHKPPARALGEGVYRILRHQHKKDKKMHTHLIYKLEFPSTEGEAAEQQPQEALKQLALGGSFLLQIKNPTQKGRNEFRGLKRKGKPVFPKHLQERFGKLRYHAVDPPDFLNYQGCEFLLISASDNIREELGVDVHEDSSCSDLINTFGAETSTDALLKGIWDPCLCIYNFDVITYTLIRNSGAPLLLSVLRRRTVEDCTQLQLSVLLRSLVTPSFVAQLLLSVVTVLGSGLPFVLLMTWSRITFVDIMDIEKDIAEAKLIHAQVDAEVNIEKEQLMRFIVMGQKSLPDPTSKKKGRPYWGFVEMVTTNIQDIKDALKGEEYETKTRGHRHKPPARALGEGVYRILRHQHKNDKKMHTHLIYKLEFPSTEGEAAEQQPQEALNVAKVASFLLQIKNPTQKGRNEFRGLKRKRKPVFPKHLQGRFGKLGYHAADPPDFLNYQGCEFLLISASDNIHEELGVEVHEDSSCSDLINTFGAETSTDALLKGIWDLCLCIYKLHLTPAECVAKELSYTLICNSDAQLLLSVVTVMGSGLPFVLCSDLIIRKPFTPQNSSQRFGKLRYHAADPPDFLNYQGCEFLLISASDNIQEELGVDVHEDSSCSDLINTFGAETSTDASLEKQVGFEAVNIIVLASDDMKALLPYGDPLLRKCEDSLDSLANSAVRLAQSSIT